MRFYDFRKVPTTIDGIELVSAWAPGDDVFKASRVKASAESEVGADGHMVLSLNADKSGEVTIKLAQTSPLNAYLSKKCQAQDQIDTFVPVTVDQFDTYRGDKVATSVGYIEKHAEHNRGAKANAVEWKLIFEEIHFDLGDPSFTGLPTSVAEVLG